MEKTTEPNLDIGRYRLLFTTAGVVQARPRQVLGWRGAFGNQLKNLCCPMAAKTCNGCMFKEGCIYNYLFETPPPPGAKRMKSYPSVPHPYVFTVPAEREKENCYVVEFVLVGKYALEKVEGLPQGKSSRQAQELVSQASSLPAMIRINGLGQAVAFYRMKGGVHRGLYELLSGWLCAGGRPYAGFSDLIEGITQSDMHTYRMAQFEAEQLLSWVKKFAKAFAPEQGQVVEEAGVGEGSP